MDEITTVKNQVKFAGWISMVEECQNSGLSIRTWCKENNICYKTYLYRYIVNDEGYILLSSHAPKLLQFRFSFSFSS